MPPKKSEPVRDERLEQTYNVMQAIENRLGGGEGVQGIYGSITRTGMQRIFDCMKHNCGFDKNSVLIDVGAGLGRPLVHALVNPGIRSAFGVELDHVKVAKAGAFMEQTLNELAKRGQVAADIPRPTIQCTSVEEVHSFGSATHAYSFWEGIPVEGREAFGRLFAASKSMKCVAVVQRAIRGDHPSQLLKSYGFGHLMLISNFSVSMSGSGASFQAYIFSRIPDASVSFFAAAATKAQHGTKAQHASPVAEPPVLNAKAQGQLQEACMVDGDENNPALRRSARQRAAQHAQQSGQEQTVKFAPSQQRPAATSPSLSSSSVAAAVAVMPDVDDTGSQHNEERLPEHQSQPDSIPCDPVIEVAGQAHNVPNESADPCKVPKKQAAITTFSRSRKVRAGSGLDIGMKPLKKAGVNMKQHVSKDLVEMPGLRRSTRISTQQ